MSIDKLLEEFKAYKIDVEGKAEDSIDLYIRNIKKSPMPRLMRFSR